MDLHSRRTEIVSERRVTGIAMVSASPHFVATHSMLGR